MTDIHETRLSYRVISDTDFYRVLENLTLISRIVLGEAMRVTSNKSSLLSSTKSK